MTGGAMATVRVNTAIKQNRAQSIGLLPTVFEERVLGIGKGGQPPRRNHCAEAIDGKAPVRAYFDCEASVRMTDVEAAGTTVEALGADFVAQCQQRVREALRLEPHERVAVATRHRAKTGAAPAVAKLSAHLHVPSRWARDNLTLKSFAESAGLFAWRSAGALLGGAVTMNPWRGSYFDTEVYGDGEQKLAMPGSTLAKELPAVHVLRAMSGTFDSAMDFAVQWFPPKWDDAGTCTELVAIIAANRPAPARAPRAKRAKGTEDSPAGVDDSGDDGPDGGDDDDGGRADDSAEGRRFRAWVEHQGLLDERLEAMGVPRRRATLYGPYRGQLPRGGGATTVLQMRFRDGDHPYCQECQRAHESNCYKLEMVNATGVVTLGNMKSACRLRVPVGAVSAEPGGLARLITAFHERGGRGSLVPPVTACAAFAAMPRGAAAGALLDSAGAAPKVIATSVAGAGGMPSFTHTVAPRTNRVVTVDGAGQTIAAGPLHGDDQTALPVRISKETCAALGYPFDVMDALGLVETETEWRMIALASQCAALGLDARNVPNIVLEKPGAGQAGLPSRMLLKLHHAAGLAGPQMHARPHEINRIAAVRAVMKDIQAGVGRAPEHWGCPVAAITLVQQNNTVVQVQHADVLNIVQGGGAAPRKGRAGRALVGALLEVDADFGEGRLRVDPVAASLWWCEPATNRWLCISKDELRTLVVTRMSAAADALELTPEERYTVDSDAGGEQLARCLRTHERVVERGFAATVDADPMLFPVHNGVFQCVVPLDRDGEGADGGEEEEHEEAFVFRATRPEDRVQQAAPWSYSAESAAAHRADLEAFLSQVVADPAERRCLLAHFAQVLVGLRTHKSVLVLTDQMGGNNGKSSVLALMKEFCGPRAMPDCKDFVLAAAGSRAGGDPNSHKAGLARLKGRRMLVADELGAAVAFDMPAIKQFCGGSDSFVSGRGFMSAAEFAFRFEAILVLATNAGQVPRFAVDDHAFVERMSVMSFRSKFVRAEALADERKTAENPGLVFVRDPRVLRKFPLWMPALADLLVASFVHGGRSLPEAPGMRAWRQQLVEEQNPLAGWLEDNLEKAPPGAPPLKLDDMYAAYVDGLRGKERAILKREFGRLATTHLKRAPAGSEQGARMHAEFHARLQSIPSRPRSVFVGVQLK